MIAVALLLGLIATACGSSSRSVGDHAVSLPAARDGFGAVITRSGDGVVFGGSRSNRAVENFATTAWWYRAGGRRWRAIRPLPLARDPAGVFADGRVYAIGGDVFAVGDGYTSVGEVDAYSPTTGRWTLAAPMPAALDAFGVVAAPSGLIYVLGGGQLLHGNGGAVFATAQVYHPRTDSWTTAAPMPTARWNVTAVALGGRIYTIGGGPHAMPARSVTPS